MSEELRWVFPVDNADQWDGFNESGINTFSGSPITHLAREVIQNSIDAGTEGAVKVSFNLRRLRTEEIPGLGDYKKSFEACLRSSKSEGEEARGFFKRAKQILSKKEIPVLEVSDFNTTGVEGPCELGKPFYAFLKAKGQSKKQDDTAAGSFGIGKFAPYAVSDLRTVFVSTVYKTKKSSLKQLTQGKAILISHDVDEKRHQGTGFFGKPDLCMPIVGNASISNQLLRSGGKPLAENMVGTTISILGFKETKNWEKVLKLSIAISFFSALYRQALVVDINGEVLNHENVHRVLRSENNKEIVKGTDIEVEEVERADSYLLALSSESSITECSEQNILGHVQLKLNVSDGLPRRIAVIRNGMFITDRPEGLKRFSGYKDFSGIIEFLSDTGSSFMRKMEPPRHDTFEPERLPTEQEQKKARKALKDLSEWVRKMLGRHAKDPVTEETAVDELAEYFADEDELAGAGGGFEKNPLSAIDFSTRPFRRSLTKRTSSGEDESKGPGEDGDGGGGKNTGKGGGGGEALGGSGPSGVDSSGGLVSIENVRMIPVSGKELRIGFTPLQTANANLLVKAAGADSDELLSVKNTSVGQLENNAVKLALEKDKRINLQLSISEEVYGAIKIELYEIR